MGQSNKTNTPAAKRRQQSKKGEHGYIHETHPSCRVQHEISPPDNYIRNQPEHHRTTSFEEETINILRRHEIEFDRKYLFETEHHG